MQRLKAIRTQRMAELGVHFSANKCFDLFPRPSVPDLFALRTHRRNSLERIDPCVRVPQLLLGLFQLMAPLKRGLKRREEQVNYL